MRIKEAEAIARFVGNISCIVFDHNEYFLWGSGKQYLKTTFIRRHFKDHIFIYNHDEHKD